MNSIYLSFTDQKFSMLKSLGKWIREKEIPDQIKLKKQYILA